MALPFSKIQTLINNNKLKVKNKFYYVYSLNDHTDIYVGRNQDGNQQLLDLLKNDPSTEAECWWFHLYSSTSAHAIIHETTCEPDKHKLYEAFRWVYNVLFANNKNDLIFTRLNNVKCTKTKGLVTFKDEQYVGKIDFINSKN
jgi:hypothetical protein